MFTYELGKAFLFFMMCLNSSVYKVYKILHNSFYDVFGIAQSELLVDDLSFLFDTSAGDYPFKNRIANFCLLATSVYTRKNKWLFIRGKEVVIEFWTSEALAVT